MTWDQSVTAFAGLAFLWIWKQLHEEVKALRQWRHGLEGAMAVVDAAIRTLDARLGITEREVDKLRASNHRASAVQARHDERLTDLDARVDLLQRRGA